MRVEHRLTVVGRCPVADCPDVYECVVRTDRVVMVEDIVAAVKFLTTTPRTQEDLTQSLADRLGCEVETAGEHSGVKTLCVCSSAAEPGPSSGLPAGGTATS